MKNIMIKNLGFAAVALCVSGNVLANCNVYATIGGGWTIPSVNSNTEADSGYTHYGPTAAPSGESFFNLPSVKWQNNYKDGFNLNAAVGYKFHPSIRGDVEFLYQRFKRDLTGTFSWAEYDALSAARLDFQPGISMAPASTYTNVYSLLTSGYYDFHYHSKWTPLLGAGFGIAWITSSTTTAQNSFTTPAIATPTPATQVSPSFSGTAFAWQLKAGVAYEYSKDVAIVMQYRLFATTSFISDPSSIITNPNGGPTVRRVFRVSQQYMRGLFTNALEMQLRFNMA